MYSLVNMRVDMDKNLVKDVTNTFKTAISYPPKLALVKISYVNFCKLANYKRIDNFEQVVPPFDINLK